MIKSMAANVIVIREHDHRRARGRGAW